MFADTFEIEVGHEVKLLTLASLSCAFVDALLVVADMLGEEVPAKAIMLVGYILTDCFMGIGPLDMHLK